MEREQEKHHYWRGFTAATIVFVTFTLVHMFLVSKLIDTCFG